KTKAARGIGKLQAAHAEVGQNTVHLLGGGWLSLVGQLRKGAVPEFDRGPVRRLAFRIAKGQPRTTHEAFPSFPHPFEPREILIEATQPPRGAGAFCDFETVPA